MFVSEPTSQTGWGHLFAELRLCIPMGLWCQFCTASGKQTGREEIWGKKRRQIWHTEAVTVHQPQARLPNYLSLHTCLPVGLSVSAGVMCKPDSDFCDADRWTGLGNGTDCSWCDGTVIEVVGNFVEPCFPTVVSRQDSSGWRLRVWTPLSGFIMVSKHVGVISSCLIDGWTRRKKEGRR